MSAPWPDVHEELLRLALIGQAFDQRKGRRPGQLAHLVMDCAKRGGRPFSFEQLLHELELCAARRDLHGESASPVEKVDRVFELMTFHTKKGREQKPFGTLRNHLTKAKKIISSEQFTLSAKP